MDDEIILSEVDVVREMRFMHQADMCRMERANRRVWIVAIILAILLFASNAIWLLTDVGYQEEQTIEAAQKGNGSYFVSGGGINYGLSEGQNNND